MIRTRVGYCGGSTSHPTYRSIGDHTEAISIDFDPAQIRYEDLLDRFWRAHPCQSPVYSLQYRHAIFCRNEPQKEAAEKSRSRQAKVLSIPESEITTQIVPIETFTLAELYHQKYRLAPHDPIRIFLETTYPGIKAFADSSVATRLNAALGLRNARAHELVLRELTQYGLPEQLVEQIKKQL